MERLPPDTPWMTAPSVRAVIGALEAAGGPGCARFVGGCIRDTLLGRGDQLTDVDIATPLHPDRVIAALNAAGLRAVPTGIEHGTVTAISEGKPYEITTLRRDVETDGRRAVVAFTTSWEEDAERRDFRLNALYADPDGALHDPTGGGLADVRARRIVFVGDPETRIREDYLRILRFFRFLSRVGDAAQADTAGLAACAKLKDGIAGLSGERVQQEMFKLLGAPDPIPGVRLMAEASVLVEVLPDAGELRSLGELVGQDHPLGTSDSVLRLAALLPDKPEAMARVAGRLRLSNTMAKRLRALCSDPGSPIAVDMEEAAVRRTVFAIGRQAFEDRLRLAAADSDCRPDIWLERLQIARTWSPPPFPITGDEIKALGVPEGPQVGVIRKALEDWWVAGDFTATKAEAMAELERLAASFREPRP